MIFMVLNEGISAASFSTRWQHGSWICFATFILWKITKLLKTEQPLKVVKNKHRFGILRIFLNQIIKFYLIKLATDFYRQPSYLLGESSLMYGNLCHWKAARTSNGFWISYSKLSLSHFSPSTLNFTLFHKLLNLLLFLHFKPQNQSQMPQ